MELLSAIHKRRTIRDFSSEKVEQAVIEKALACGLKAPSYNHLKQCEFIIIDDLATKLELIQSEKIKDVKPEDIVNQFEGAEQVLREMYLDAIPKQRKMILGHQLCWSLYIARKHI